MTSRLSRVAVVPGVFALLPEHASLVDPVADLRAACLAAVGWLGADVEVLADDAGHRVAAALLNATREDRVGAGTSVLVVANGSACRSEKAPGHLDLRAGDFDDDLGAALRAFDLEGLAQLDVGLAAELWASVVPLTGLRSRLDPDDSDEWSVRVDYDDDPFGVRYWVVRAQIA